MTHLGRVATEQALQGLAIMMSLADRLLLTALLFRVWGASVFEAWNVCVALSGLVMLCELGFGMYFSNRLMIEVENGRPEAAQRTLWLANTIFSLCALASLSVALWIVLFQVQASPGVSWEEASAAVGLLAAAGAVRLGLVAVHALYRAHRQLSRFTLITVTGDVLRIGAVVAVVLLGGGIGLASLATFIATLALQGIFVMWDVRGRFALRAFGWACPTLADLRQIVPPSAAYFAQIIPLIVLMHAPVLVVHGASTATGLVAGFVLLRSLGGLPRGLLQSLGAILGQECARRLAIGDGSGAFRVLCAGAQAFAVLSGLCAGYMLGGGREIVAIWTGDGAIWRLDYMVAAIAPMLLAATSVTMHNVLSASNTPYLAAVGRSLQLAITVAVALAAPIADPGLRVLIALSAGEIAGFTPLSYVAVARLIPGAHIGFHLHKLALTAGTALAGYGMAFGAFALLAPQSLAGRILALALAGVGCGLVFAALGVPAEIRRRLLDRVRPALARLRTGRLRIGRLRTGLLRTARLGPAGASGSAAPRPSQETT